MKYNKSVNKDNKYNITNEEKNIGEFLKVNIILIVGFNLIYFIFMGKSFG